MHPSAYHKPTVHVAPQPYVALHGSHIPVFTGNAQYVYGERLSALFGTSVAVEGVTGGTVEGRMIHFNLDSQSNCSCCVLGVNVTGVRDGKFLMVLTETALESLEAIEEVYNQSAL